jgi:hypothetical protein
LRDINYAARLWQVFKAIISGALNELKELLGDAVTLGIETIEKHINCFFVQALQLDPKTLLFVLKPLKTNNIQASHDPSISA